MAKAGDIEIGNKAETDDRRLGQDELEELIHDMAQMLIDLKVNVEK